MKPVKSEILSSSNGDCFRAVIASLLELPLNDVPHFFEGGDATALQGWADIDQFLAARELAWSEMVISGAVPVRELLSQLVDFMPNTFLVFIGRGMSTNHAVIVLNGEIVHDPNAMNIGINGPDSSGVYRIGVLVPALLKSE